MQKFKDIIIRLLLAQRSPHKLALAFCAGAFIAFSPFIGFHTLMMIVVAWWCRLNFAMMYASSHIFNNPITVAPLFWANYIVGKLFCTTILGYIPENPAWMHWLNTQITYYTNLSGISLWPFIIGGNILGGVISIALYPFILWLFKRIIKQDRTENA